ncbi:hypothetical protein RJ641_010089 [Dillenia turbinata]|uniref:Uncharacterized protein n=1 Tax=Dillenia turbinata TaxID=194707 RepID=A0AAN8UZU9_9MAGN
MYAFIRLLPSTGSISYVLEYIPATPLLTVLDVSSASSIMAARGALWNASIFSSKGLVPWEDVKKEYVRKCILWDNDIKSTKHTLKEMIMHYSSLELPEGKAVIKSDNLEDIARLYGEERYYQLCLENRFQHNGGN